MRVSYRMLAIVGSAAIVASLAQPVSAAPGTATTPTSRVIVQFTGAPALSGATGLTSADAATRARARESVREHAAALRGNHASFRRQAAAAGIHSTVTSDFSQVINAVALTINPADEAKLRALPGVAGVYPDQTMHATDIDPDLTNINAPQVWQTQDPAGQAVAGAGQTVAVVDTGIDYSHPDLGGGFGAGHKVVGGYDYVNQDADPRDDNGHGTHVAGIIAGDSASGAGRVGVAPKASLTAYKVLDSSGYGDESTIMEGLEAAVSVDNPHRADVVNLSLSGPPTPNDPLEQACEQAVHAGVVVVAAAGNYGPGESTVGSPAEAPDVLAVGASAAGIDLPTLTVTSPVQHQMNVARIGLSANPAAGGEDLALVDVGAGISESDYDGVDVAGKAVFIRNTAEAFALPALTLAQEHGAAAAVFRGVNIYSSAGPQPGPLVDVAAGTADDPDKLHVVAVEANGADGTDLQQWLDQGPVTIHIGSVDATDQMAAFSAHGPALGSYALKPDLVAPGVEIGSTWLDGGYQDESGTSMAAPHVAGAAALLFQAHPTWTGAQVAAALTGGAKQLSGYDGTTQGAGRLDIAAADGLTVLPDERAADLGLADLSNTTMQSSTTVSFTNTSAKAQTLSLAAHPAPGSAGTAQVAPRAGLLPPGGQLTVRLTVTGARPETGADLTGWLQATTLGGSTVSVPYLLAARPLDLHPDPDPAPSATTVYLHAEPDLATPPTLTVTGPDHHISQVTATFDHTAWWRAAVPAGPAGLYQLSASARAASGVTLTGASTVEELGGATGRDWQSVGPDSTGAGQMAFTSLPGRMYAIPTTLSHPVVFRTDDGGASWQELRNLPLGDGASYGLAADPTDPDTVYLAVRGARYGDPTYFGRVLVSHDAGTSWTILPYPDVSPSRLAIDATGTDLTVTPEDGDVLVSIDRGQTWTSYPTPEGYANNARIIGHDLYIAAGTNVYAVRNVDTDPSPMQTVLTSPTPYDFMADIIGDAHLLVAHSEQQVFVSHDAGETWQGVLTAPDNDPMLYSAQLLNGTIYVGGFGHIWSSADAGATWTTLRPPVPVDEDFPDSEFSVGAWPGDPDHLIVDVTGTGLFSTSDGGASYQRIGLTGAHVHALVVSQNTTGQAQLLAGTSYSTFATGLPTSNTVDAATRDWGITGEEDLIGGNVTTVGVDPANPKIVFRAGTNAQGRLSVDRSDDGGATWTGVAGSRSPSRPGQIIVDPANPDIVYLTVTDSISPGVMVSRDGGQTWRDNQTPVVVKAIAADPQDPNRIWLGGPDGLYRSDDQGQTLTRLASTPVTALAVDPRNSQHLLIGGHGLYDSVDGGHTVRVAHTSGARLNISELLVGADGTVYAADSNYADVSTLPISGRGVLASRDGGRSYDNISAGLADRNVEGIALSPDGRWLYAGTGSGSVYRVSTR